MTPLAMLRAAFGAAPAGLIADYDGTLSPIVADPMSAVPAPGAAPLLRELAARLAVVAIVTGRAPLDARRFLGVDQVLVAGNHGLEWLEPGEAAPVAPPGLDGARRAMDAALRAAGDLALPSVVLEPKGISATIHYRGAPLPDAARRAILDALRNLDPALVEVREGRMSVELRPAAAGDKGTALRRIVERFALRGLVVLGDDLTDLDMFRAAAALRAAGELRACIGAVGVRGEVPDAVLDAADFAVADPAALVTLLRDATRPER